MGYTKNSIFVWSRISKFLHPTQRYDDFKLIRITCQAACHGKTEHGIFVKFKKPSKTAVVLILLRVHRLHFYKIIAGWVPQPLYDEASSWACPMAKLNMTYLSSLKNRAKLLLRPNPATLFYLYMMTSVKLYYLFNPFCAPYKVH